MIPLCLSRANGRGWGLNRLTPPSPSRCPQFARYTPTAPRTSRPAKVKHQPLPLSPIAKLPSKTSFFQTGHRFQEWQNAIGDTPW